MELRVHCKITSMLQKLIIPVSCCFFLLGLQRSCYGSTLYRNYYKVVVNTRTDYADWKDLCRQHSPIKYSPGETPWYDLAYFETNEEVNRAFKLLDRNERLLIEPRLSLGTASSNQEFYTFKWNLYFHTNQMIYTDERFKYPVSPMNLTDAARRFYKCAELISNWGKPEFVNADCTSRKALCMAKKSDSRHEVKPVYKNIKYFLVRQNDNRNIEDLQKICKSNGGDMAIIKTLQDVLWAEHALKETGALIGARRVGNSRHYRNHDGTPLDVPHSFWDDSTGGSEPNPDYECVTIVYDYFVKYVFLKTDLCRDVSILCQYGLGTCKFDIVPRRIHLAHVVKVFKDVHTELDCMKKCDKGCGHCVMSFNPYLTGQQDANCLQAGFSAEYYHTIKNKDGAFGIDDQTFDSKWATLVPVEGGLLKPLPVALWPLDSVAMGANVMVPVNAPTLYAPPYDLEWNVPGPKANSKLRFARSSSKSVIIPFGPKISSAFTLAAWIKTDAFAGHGVPIFEGRPWQKSFSLLFAAEQHKELHLDTHHGSIHTNPSPGDASKWRHVAMVRKSASDFELFINGKIASQLFRTEMFKPHAFEMEALCLFGTCDNFIMRGSLGCLSYFDSALNAESITRVMNFCP